MSFDQVGNIQYRYDEKISQSKESVIYFFLTFVISVLRKYFHHEIPGKVSLNFLYLATMIKWWVRLIGGFFSLQG